MAINSNRIKYDALNEKLTYFKKQKRELGNDKVGLIHGHNHSILNNDEYCKDFIEKLTKQTNEFIDKSIAEIENEMNALFKS